MDFVQLNQVKHIISSLHDDSHFSMSFTRNIETSVMYNPIWTISSTLEAMGIPLLASLHLYTVDPGITSILTSHTNLDAHLLWMRQLTQTDHHFKQDLLHDHSLQDVITSILATMAHMHPLIIIVPVSTIPMDTVLMSIILLDTTPIDIVPMDTIPTDTIPMESILMAMDPVTHHPIGKAPTITITGAMAHHLGTQKKEVQAKVTFPLNGDHLDMFTDSLH